MDTLLREVTLSKMLCPPSEKGSTLKAKNLLPSLLRKRVYYKRKEFTGIGDKFFHLRIDPKNKQSLFGAYSKKNDLLPSLLKRGLL